jgi:hypothetical protein
MIASDRTDQEQSDLEEDGRRASKAQCIQAVSSPPLHHWLAARPFLVGLSSVACSSRAGRSCPTRCRSPVPACWRDGRARHAVGKLSGDAREVCS